MKTVVYIDGPNFYHCQRGLGLDIDFRRLREYFAATYTLMRINYYTATDDRAEYDQLRPLMDWLSYNGYQTVTKQTQKYTQADGTIRFKGNMDVDLAVDCLDFAWSAKPDRVILASGDGDFVPLVKALQRRGIIVQALSSLKTTPIMISDELRRQTDEFADLDAIRHVISRDRPEVRSVA